MENPNKDKNQEQKLKEEDILKNSEEIESLNDNEELENEDLDEISGGCVIRGCNKSSAFE